MKSSILKARKTQIVVAVLSVIATVAFADTHWYCQEGAACGTEQEATVSNGCEGIVCPKRETCTTEDGDANNCTPGSEQKKCHKTQGNGLMGHCTVMRDAGETGSATTCATCVIN